MPSFATPEPPLIVIESTGRVRLTASDRADTVVQVRAAEPDDETDIEAAGRTLVEHAAGRLLIRTPTTRPRSLLGSLFGHTGNVDITLEVPSGSHLEARHVTDVHATGRLGRTRLSAAGEVWLDRTGPLRLHTADGEITITGVEGDAEVVTANGRIRVDSIEGGATVKTANGQITLGEVRGDLALNTASGDITVARALAGVQARTAYGSIRVGEVVRGSVTLDTAYGNLEVGIGRGSAAWLDVSTQYGRVHSDLDAATGPEEAEETVEVRAHTGTGDIRLTRA
ncbi:DUF4097 family beta strand repeat-containing protein [Actinomadura hibisca]|uniref:DUF4097 family beta strand repeat-containing protein n=1 Tax=Actinomadura hibisca TaxID=68565 RepID=UPI00082D2568|nr:DUF4097 family beta strand repeat-containing protein [Actinomadura hibisca]